MGQPSGQPSTARARIVPLVCALLVTLPVAAEQAPVSAHFMAQAIATSGWYAMEECPVSTVEERSPPGCARIPAPLETAVEWLDLLDRAVFEETRREGEWLSQRDMRYTTWRLELTGQRYLLVLAPHPHWAITLLYVSELQSVEEPTAGG
jgi:hypothetical protein